MSTRGTNKAARLVAIVCTAQVFVQLGAGYWPVLLPELLGRWSLTNSEAGWITSAFYAAYMCAVPVLVTLTDRIDAKRVYLFGVGCTTIAHLALRRVGRRLLVGRPAARAGRPRLGRHLHDRAEAPGRPGRCQDDVARRHRPCRQHRHLGRPLLRAGRSSSPRVRLAARLCQRRPHRRHRLAHRGARRARPRASGPSPPGRRRRCSTSARCCATARPSPTRWPTACTRWR